MSEILSTGMHVLLFLSLYVQVFFLVTFLENRKKIITRNGPTSLSRYPKVTIIVPAWNEEKTLYNTVKSLLALNYPKNKFRVFLIDDGSTDGTWNAMSKFSKNPNVKIFRKENGGKYTALNLGLEHTDTEFVGCLDADSIAHPESLARIMSYFEKDPSAMAVAPSVIALKGKGIVQSAQRAEYDMSVYVKKMLGFMGAIHVTPGPLTIFRKKVFDTLGPYRHAHNTEDMEIAYRMQEHRYKIEQCNDAYIYTNTPSTVKKLYRQRTRWIFGFINNTIDYRRVIFRKKYGNFALFTLPSGIISVFAVSLIFGNLLARIWDFILTKITQFKITGFEFVSNFGNLDPFFINTKSLVFISILIYSLIIFSIFFGKKIVEGKWHFPFYMLYFFLVFSIVGPFWLLKAVYNTALSRNPAWR